MTIETERLRIVALNARQLKLWTENVSALEKELNCVYRAEPMEKWFVDILTTQQKIVETDTKNELWLTFWWIIRKEDDTVVGSADFKNIPNENGEVEIGYGLGDDFLHLGYMTEAVNSMCAWAKSQIGVRSVVAETEEGNTASQAVLTRCGFVKHFDKANFWIL